MMDEATRDALRQVIDPEIGINIVDLGLVYGVERDPAVTRVRVTMTTPACPLGEHIAAEIERALRPLEAGRRVAVEIVREPPWHPDMISDEGRRLLGEEPAARKPPRQAGLLGRLVAWARKR